MKSASVHAHSVRVYSHSVRVIAYAPARIMRALTRRKGKKKKIPKKIHWKCLLIYELHVY